MITTTIGKIFLKAYNEKFNTQYDAKTFFVEQYYPLFFDQEKYMQWITNSPFVQMKKGQKIETMSKDERLEKLNNLHDKIDAGLRDASVAIGFAASEEKEFATTSGQVSNLNLNISKEDVYCSWIGSGLGVGIQGGMSILFDYKQILLDVFDGWKIYREVLNTTPMLRGNQINTWNGQWLAHKYGGHFTVDNPMADFKPFSAKDGVMSVDTLSWTKVLIAISKTFENPQMLGYVYNYGQTNTTIGFIPFALNQIRKALELYQKLFNMKSGAEAEKLYGTAFGFTKACQAGVIGLRALEPKGLREYVDKGKMPKYNNEDEEQIINFNIYKTWILAMLNNDDLWVKAQDFAKQMQIYKQSGKQTKTENGRKVEAVISAIKKEPFIELMSKLIGEIQNQDNVMETVRLVNTMPTENVPYFLTLIRFHYAAISSK